MSKYTAHGIHYTKTDFWLHIYLYLKIVSWAPSLPNPLFVYPYLLPNPYPFQPYPYLNLSPPPTHSQPLSTPPHPIPHMVKSSMLTLEFIMAIWSIHRIDNYLPLVFVIVLISVMVWLGSKCPRLSIGQTRGKLKIFPGVYRSAPLMLLS